MIIEGADSVRAEIEKMLASHPAEAQAEEPAKETVKQTSDAQEAEPKIDQKNGKKAEIKQAKQSDEVPKTVNPQDSTSKQREASDNDGPEAISPSPLIPPAGSSAKLKPKAAKETEPAADAHDTQLLAEVIPAENTSVTEQTAQNLDRIEKAAIELLETTVVPEKTILKEDDVAEFGIKVELISAIDEDLDLPEGAAVATEIVEAVEELPDESTYRTGQLETEPFEETNLKFEQFFETIDIAVQDEELIDFVEEDTIEIRHIDVQTESPEDGSMDRDDAVRDRLIEAEISDEVPTDDNEVTDLEEVLPAELGQYQEDQLGSDSELPKENSEESLEVSAEKIEIAEIVEEGIQEAIFEILDELGIDRPEELEYLACKTIKTWLVNEVKKQREDEKEVGDILHDAGTREALKQILVNSGLLQVRVHAIIGRSAIRLYSVSQLAQAA